MAFVAKAKSGTGGDWERCPEGSHQAVLCEIVDLGIVEQEFKGEKSKAHKCLFVYQVAPKDESGTEIRDSKSGLRYEVASRFTVSMHEKASLFKWVQNWRGKQFTDSERVELEVNGFDLEKLIRVNCLLQVMHNTSPDGTKTYANATSIQPWQKAWGPGIVPDDYVPRAARKKDGNGTGKQPWMEPTPAQAIAVQAPAPAQADDDVIPF